MSDIRVGGPWTCPKCGEWSDGSDIHVCGAKEKAIKERVKKSAAKFMDHKPPDKPQEPQLPSKQIAKCRKCGHSIEVNLGGMCKAAIFPYADDRQHKSKAYPCGCQCEFPTTVLPSEQAREIVKKISDAAIELAFVRHELTTTEYEDEQHGDIEEGVEAFKELVEGVKADVFACLTGDETGCLDPEDVDYDNELQWTILALTRTAASVAAEQEKDRIAQLTERINSFRRLEPDWDSYGARTICPDAIDEALRLVPMFTDPKWFVAPRSDGDIQFEADHVEVHIEGFSDPLPTSPVTAEGEQK